MRLSGLNDIPDSMWAFCAKLYGKTYFVKYFKVSFYFYCDTAPQALLFYIQNSMWRFVLINYTERHILDFWNDFVKYFKV